MHSYDMSTNYFSRCNLSITLALANAGWSNIAEQPNFKYDRGWREALEPWWWSI